MLPLSEPQTNEIEEAWSRWVTDHSADLFAPDDCRVLDRAAKNTGWAKLINSADSVNVEQHGIEVNDEEPASRQARSSDAVLVAEIPKSGNRWNQANFDLASYEAFFGAKRGTQRRILLRHVDADGKLWPVEFRPSVAVRSQNYRFELEAASGLQYPTIDRPIGVFLRLAARTFRYRLLMPSDPSYSTVRDFLEHRSEDALLQMRRIVVTVGELRSTWTNSPLWRTP